MAVGYRLTQTGAEVQEILNAVDDKAEKTSVVNNISYNPISNTIEQTINGTTTPVVSATTIVTAGGEGKQDTLVSGVNIKTINSQSVLGSGDLVVTDPTISEWARQANKPTYTAAEVGALPDTTVIPDELSDLSDDSTHRLVTDAEKASWNNKQNAISDLDTIRSGAAAGATAYQKPVTGIPASDLANGVIPDVSNFITKSVNDLTNYYLKSETYTKEEVGNLIASINQFHYEIYASTSAVTNPQNNVLYLIGPTGSGADKYEEYVYNSAWVKIGDTSIDLSGYVTTTALNTALANYTTSSDLTTLLEGYQTKIDSTHKLDYSLISNTPTKVSDFTNDSGFITTETDPVFSASAAHGITSSDISNWNSKGTYSKPSGGIPKTDLESSVQTSLGKADTALQSYTETDPTVPSWAKQSTKPTYTASEVGALPDTTVIPDELKDLSDDATHRLVTDTEKSTWNNKYTKPSGGIPASDLASGVIPDVSGFITKSVDDLTNYYTKSQTYTQSEVQQLINAVKQFTYESVSTLPTASASTMNKIYLIPSADPQTQNVKDEFITLQDGSSYSWEQIGSTAIDLDGYVTTQALNTALANYTTTSDLNTLLSGYQATLVSGTNIKTVNDTSLLGSGNISVQEVLVSGANIKTINGESVLGSGNISVTSEGGGDVNVIESISVNSTPQAIIDKNVDISIPTELSDLSDDATHRLVTDTEKSTWNAKGTYSKPASGIPASDLASGVIPDVSNFITKSVDDLVNYYTKTQTYTKNEVDSLISGIIEFEYELVAVLPTASSSTMHKIYLIPSSDPQTQNVKDEYITIESSGSYSWEQIGSTAIDLTGYVTTTDLNTALAGYQTKIDSTHKLDYSLLSNTPTIPDAQIQSDWNQTTTTAKDYIKNKPTIPSVVDSLSSSSTTSALSANQGKVLNEGKQDKIDNSHKLSADLVDDSSTTNKFVTASEKTTWNNKSDFSGSYNDLTNKPTIPSAQVNSDWNASSGVAQILNKPTIPTITFRQW